MLQPPAPKYARIACQGLGSPTNQARTRYSQSMSCFGILNADTKASQTFVDDAILIEKYNKEYRGLR